MTDPFDQEAPVWTVSGLRRTSTGTLLVTDVQEGDTRPTRVVDRSEYTPPEHEWLTKLVKASSSCAAARLAEAEAVRRAAGSAPRGLLRFNPHSHEGQAIAQLFRQCKDLEDGDGSWNGGDVVDCVTGMFQRLGLDVDGPESQLETNVIYVEAA